MMIQMANNQFLVAEIDEPVQQRDGIAPTGDADEITRIWRRLRISRELMVSGFTSVFLSF